MMFDINLNVLFSKTQEYLYKKYSLLHHVEFLEGKTVWILSPHPDDDAIGCGGTIIKHIQMGHFVHIVYLCSGDKGISGEVTNKTIKIRHKEAQDAALIMGVSTDKIYFLDIPDETLRSNIDIASVKLKNLFNSFPPDLLYLPSFLDRHNDHIATNDILKKCDLKNTIISAYEVWTPIIPNRIVDISTTVNQKQKAINAHFSQLKALEYDKAILGLNQYRAKMYTKKDMEYAEAFLALKWEEYITLY